MSQVIIVDNQVVKNMHIMERGMMFHNGVENMQNQIQFFDTQVCVISLIVRKRQIMDFEVQKEHGVHNIDFQR